MFLKELFAYIISGEFSMKFSMEKEQTITRFSDCAKNAKDLSIPNAYNNLNAQKEWFGSQLVMHKKNGLDLSS